VGECSGNTGVETCSAGAWGGDTCDPLAGSTPETCDGTGTECTEGETRTTNCGVGECAATGIQSCDNGNWGTDTCTPGTPSAEVCDNLDNDCDGTVDSITQGTTCGVGECGSTGVETCTAGSWGGDTCTPGTPSAEVCDNLDNNCDGAIDENLTQPTTCGVGECSGNTGVETCSAGAWGGDTCDPLAGATTEGPPGDQTCSDTLDNDCDGLTDLGDGNCLTATETDCFDGIDNDGDGKTDCDDNADCNGATDGACSTGQPGICSAGTRTCQGKTEICVQDSQPAPDDSVCDGLDNDCDGSVDEDCECTDGETRSCGSDVGECVAGTETCVGGQWSGVCEGDIGPSAEVCDNLDNNCDGAIDDNLTRGTTCGEGDLW
jgi:hypothetical protein